MIVDGLDEEERRYLDSITPSMGKPSRVILNIDRSNGMIYGVGHEARGGFPVEFVVDKIGIIPVTTLRHSERVKFDRYKGLERALRVIREYRSSREQSRNSAA